MFCVKIQRATKAFTGNDDARLNERSGDMEREMKDATRKAASGALAQILAVAAMLVIAGFVFYVR